MTLGIIICIALFAATYAGGRAWAQGGVTPTVRDLQQAVGLERTATNRALARKCRPTRTHYAYRNVYRIPASRVRGILRYWQTQHHRAVKASSLCGLGARAAIRVVFGEYAGQALSVAWCESRLSVNASNGGVYLGLFQMGPYARARYGHSWTAIGQSRSAHAYFVASGRDWSPWSCRPA